MAVPASISTILVDFGGVLAEEGFREGLRAIAAQKGLDPDSFFAAAERIIFECGYLTGSATEAAYWDAVRQAMGITGADEALRKEILERFALRPVMLSWVERCRSEGLRLAILSDQTDWLETIDRATGLYRRFDAVFNSYRIGKSKRDASLFSDVCSRLGSHPASTLFIDDNAFHIERARSRGLAAILFTTVEAFGDTLAASFPGLPLPGA